MSDLKISVVENFPGAVVIGGGVSGCAAAVGAARSGARVLVLERSVSLGGMSTGGMIAAWNGYRVNHCPLTAELDRRVKARFGVSQERALSHDLMKILWEEWFDELNIDYRYECPVVDAELSGDAVTGVYLAAPEGLILLRAPLFIDASGDGALAAAAEVPFELGRPGDHLTQGASLSFEIGNIAPAVDIAKLPQCFGQSYPVPAGDLCELAKKHLTPPAGHVLLHYAAENGVVTANMTNAVKFNPTSAAGRTRAIALCRKQIIECVEFLRNYLPGFENCTLHRIAEQFGVRESRHFCGKGVLTEEDIRANRVYPDWIATRNSFGFDVHSVTGSGLDENGDLSGNDPVRGYTVPLAACIPVNRNRLLLCGRNISGTHLAHSSFRVMPIVMNIGLGVGTAAALMLRGGVPAEKVDMNELHAQLLKQGVSEP